MSEREQIEPAPYAWDESDWREAIERRADEWRRRAEREAECEPLRARLKEAEAERDAAADALNRAGYLLGRYAFDDVVHGGGGEQRDVAVSEHMAVISAVTASDWFQAVLAAGTETEEHECR